MSYLMPPKPVRDPANPIGREVRIAWVDEEGDWGHYRVVGEWGEWLCLQGLDQGDAAFAGGKFWVRLSEIKMMEEWR